MYSMAFKKNSKRTVAWSLLFILLSSLFIKAVHSHPFDKRTCIVASYSKSQIVDNENDCPICQFVFSIAEEPHLFHLFFMAVLLGIQSVLYVALYSRKNNSLHYLRAPPVTLSVLL